MIRSQKPFVRPVYNPSSINETIPSSTNGGAITSYIGKVLTINYHQVLVEDILGQGGFAFVFLVRSYNQQRYALKRMYVNNPRDLESCQREIALVKEFSTHPNIVKYIDSSIQCISKHSYPNNDDSNQDDAIYEILLLTEYCSNGALINHINEQRKLGITLNERQVLRIFADICKAVSACHFRRPQAILHRDIKLENILIDSSQNYLLCDFGSAILLSSSTTNDYQQYQTNQLTTKLIQQIEEEIQRYTTLSYRAPEMIELYNRVPITLKADIWAMGCLLYKLMYNTMPFGDSILAIPNGTYVIPDDMALVYSRELNLFVRYMLEIDINKRPDIWQVSYITYKLLGINCPIPNRCQSNIPNLNTISMPLTDSESRQKRTAALSKSKSTSANLTDDSLSLGTAINPRERPRGMMPPSPSLINFNQTTQRPPAAVVPPPLPPTSSSSSVNSSRSSSAANMKFADDFSQISSHAISLNNIPTKTDQVLSRARPSPPATISSASGLTAKQHFLLPPPPPSNIHTHRRSASQTVSSTTNQSSFHNASSVDSSDQTEVFNDDEDKSILPKNRKSQSANHQSSTEEAKKNISSSINESTTVNVNANPFLHAPFHHSTAAKQTPVSTFDPNSIVIGKRTSAFTPYQKQEIHSHSSNTDVFTNAPFKAKTKTKPSIMTDNESAQNVYTNFTFHNPMADEYF